ncbi:MAG TPA: CsbD family protein, partial [Acidimicrobiales bacterium]|nr:CsbD family protein [Acidimicrobiales bacterium]
MGTSNGVGSTRGGSMSAADGIKGVIKEAAGRLTGDRRLQVEGRADQAKARAGQTMKVVNEKVDQAKVKA